MNRHTSLAALLCAGLLSACGKDAVQEVITAPLPAARIRFFNFGVNAPGVNFYADATKMTAITSASREPRQPRESSMAEWGLAETIRPSRPASTRDRKDRGRD